MGEIFEKLLLINEILSEEELAYYKKLLASAPKPLDLGEILLEKELIDQNILMQLHRAEKQSEEYFRKIRKQKKDKKVLEVIQKLGIVRQQEIAICMRERHKAESQGQETFLTDLLVQKKYLTPYLVDKFYRKAGQRITLPPGIKNHEDMVVNIPKYLENNYLSKIALKNNVVTPTQLAQCWHTLKKHWPHKSLSHIFMEKNIVSEKKMSLLIKVLKQSITEKYPYFHAHVRDTKLARLLVKKNFLSPWRINKCLLKQWEQIKHNKYIAIRNLLIEDGYFTPYQFDVVLKNYGEYVSAEMPALFLMPPDETTDIQRDDGEKLTSSDISLSLDEDEYEENVAFMELEEEATEHKQEIELTPDEAFKNSKDIGLEEQLPKIPTVFWKSLAKPFSEDVKYQQPQEIPPLNAEQLGMEGEIEAVEICEEIFENVDFDMQRVLDEVAEEAVEYFSEDFPLEQPKDKEDNKKNQ